MPSDKFHSSSDSLIAPSSFCFAITPSDALDLPAVTKALYVGTGGNVTLVPVDNAAPVTFVNVPGGAILDVRVSQVRTTGTDASDLVGLA
ncbi:spike base protein, RCAP_Rcc01079 family [Erythrobacter sp. HA6-11]